VRIGHCGTGGTGKTTLAKALADVLDISYRPSVVREVYNEFGWTEENQRKATPAQCWRLQEKIFERKMIQDKYYGKDVVFDRTPIDHLAYCIYRCELALNEQTLKDLESRTREETLKYDLVVYHPIPSWNPEPDGMREDEYAYRRIIDAIMLGYLHIFELSYIIVPDGDLKTRRDSVYNYVQAQQWAHDPQDLGPVGEGTHLPSGGRVLQQNREQETAETTNPESPDKSRLEASDESGV